MNHKETLYNWYALRTVPHKEKYVSLELRNRGFEWYLPYFKVYFKKNNYKEKLLITSYIFVRASSLDFEKLLYIPGSKGLLYYNDKPGIIAEEEIEVLRAICGHKELEPELNKYEPGARVKILSGFLIGHTASICKCENKKLGIELSKGNFIIWINPDEILFEFVK